MKKNIVKIVLMLGAFVLGIAYTNTARAGEDCYTASVYCSDGGGGYVLICGSSADERLAEYDDMIEVLCID